MVIPEPLRNAFCHYRDCVQEYLSLVALRDCGMLANYQWEVLSCVALRKINSADMTISRILTGEVEV